MKIDNVSLSINQIQYCADYADCALEIPYSYTKGL